MKYEIEKWFKFVNYSCSDISMSDTLDFFSQKRTSVFNMFGNLSWNTDIELQTKAIEYLAENLLPCEYIYLVMPDSFSLKPYNKNSKYYERSNGKEMWENAAKTIVKIGWPSTDNIIVPLFMWLLDSNWPGWDLIYDFLLSLPNDVLHKKIKQIIDNPELYEPCDYNDLCALITIMCNTI